MIKLTGFYIFSLILLSSCYSENRMEETQVALSSTPPPEFNIRFPDKTGEYVEKQSKTPNDLLKGDSVVNWVLSGKDQNGPYMYFVAYNKLPTQLMSTLSNNRDERIDFFKGSLISSAQKLGGKNFVFHEIEYKRQPGLESSCQVFNGNGIIKSRAIIYGEYIFVVSGGGRRVEEEKVDLFLNSFKL